ncbi:hypothetical protein HQ584_02230 [Patescibacteria group bacterium]|nr:hypothetical protein [Patescibacteria group bacterium]
MVHQLGHTFELTHCNNARYGMHFFSSLSNTDRKEKRVLPGL